MSAIAKVTAAIMAATLAMSGEAVAKPLAIVNAEIYPSPNAPLISDGVVLVQDGKIIKVGTRAEVSVPKTARVIDAHGAVLTAGFWNSHVHIMPSDLMGAKASKAATLEEGIQAMLTHWGFTTVFDLGSSTENTLALRKRIASGDIDGPMILTCGDPFFPEGGTPIYVRQYLADHGWANEEVSTPKEAADRAVRQLDRGTDAVKIFAGAIVGGDIGVLPMRLDIAKAVVAEAHKRGKPAFAHPSNYAGINVAIDSGVDVLAHTTATEDGSHDPYGWTPELIARMRAHNMALTPTMTLFEWEAHKIHQKPEVTAQTIKLITSEVKDFSAAGGEILFGTDVGYTDAYDTTEEYRLMSGALDWRQILASLTTTPASRFGYAAHKGRIAPGMEADLVLLDGDPSKDPTAFARVRDTIRGGRVIWGADR
ncbi:amidohydrolase family protein [Dyella amyloliquefaciens]|uniref:amidohydrolase family protein n=1 Tax=Dyella amyloliquefaciens TaxID=1770545 RepID=UPI00102E7B4F|nr:amidohydrolase family protein [Dyella amyloliquefaciens]